ncbi:unnamed protein product [marine sediment metagenome]|uniref:Uncharacterized protein n=1 Tax=marine sediment metagenome TaxID=412755 RepID=X1AG38_9ZZZZ
MTLNATIKALGGMSPNPKAATVVKQFKDHEDKSSVSLSSKLHKSIVFQLLFLRTHNMYFSTLIIVTI